MNVKIGYLADHPDTVPVIARWLFNEWGFRSPDGSAEGMARKLSARLQRDTLPLALVALKEGVPVGTVSLKIREMEIRPQYKHWLGTLYVAEEQRRQGVGSLLVNSAKSEAARLGIDRLYLYTRQAMTKGLYERLGWVEVERPEYRGRPAIIMKADLDAQHL